MLELTLGEPTMEVLALSDITLVVVAVSYVVIDKQFGLVTADLPCILQGFLEQNDSLCIVLDLYCNSTHLDQ